MSANAVIGLLHPGEMGSAIGRCLTGLGLTALWASDGRGPETAARAQEAGLTDVQSVAAMAERAAVIIAICPPDTAVTVAESVTGFAGLYVDANAIARRTAEQVARIVEARGATYVDGSVIGPPPSKPGGTRLYLSGASARDAQAIFDGTALDARVLTSGPYAASGIKMAYAAWTKGSAALLLAARALAEAEGVADALGVEWTLSQPALEARAGSAGRSAAAKGWRWSGEMRQIASAMREAGLPGGFHDGAAEIFDHYERPE